MPAILLVDDDKDFSMTVVGLLEEEDFRVQTAYSGRDGLEILKDRQFDLVLLDLELPDISGLEVLRNLRGSGQNAPVVIITAYGSIGSAVSAIHLGAKDYLEKPVEREKLNRIVKEILSPEREVQYSPARSMIVGDCAEIRAVWHLVDTFGPTDLPILLLGETGTGKELFSRAIHDVSKWREGPLVPLDCAGLSESLIESELFGYEKGAFTGAHGNKPGMMEWAHGGTLFLDEIGEMSLSAQVKLLRAIETQQITPVGARRPRTDQLNVRFISASNRDLRETVEQGEFREDLFYRLAGVIIELPPLRTRISDLNLLVEHFLDHNRKIHNKNVFGISPAALDILRMHRWPGNVRELHHVIGVASVEAGDTILPKHLPPYLSRAEHKIGPDVSASSRKACIRTELECDLGAPIDLKKIKAEVAYQAELQIISDVRRLHEGTMVELAEFLGIDPKTLRCKLRELDRS